MMAWFWRIFFFLYATTFTSPLFAASEHQTFLPSEHVMLGDQIKLYFSSNHTGQTDYFFHLPNGLTVTYGEIISLGDFYEIVDQPIVYGKSDTERKARFLAAFDSLARTPASVSEANQILAIIRNEKKMIETALKNGEKPEDVYKKIGSDQNRQYNCITGGGCSPSTWWTKPGRYLNLAANNYDHFGENAWLAFKIGHDAALEQAMLAYQTHDLKKLEMAYAMNAFASHFLSDRFSAGHIRTPREELATHVTPSEIGSALSGYMHNEENSNSIHVHNLRGDRWIAYGDGYYFNERNSTHRIMINEALQTSVDRIFYAYQFGVEQKTTDISTIIPIPDEINNESRLDISPLFYWDNATEQLMRREDTANLYDRHWTASWWGWSTLALLSQQKGIPVLAQAQIALSGHGKEAMRYGLITDKHIAAYIQSHS